MLDDGLPSLSLLWATTPARRRARRQPALAIGLASPCWRPCRVGGRPQERACSRVCLLSHRPSTTRQNQINPNQIKHHRDHRAWPGLWLRLGTCNCSSTCCAAKPSPAPTTEQPSGCNSSSTCCAANKDKLMCSSIFRKLSGARIICRGGACMPEPCGPSSVGWCPSPPPRRSGPSACRWCVTRITCSLAYGRVAAPVCSDAVALASRSAHLAALVRCALGASCYITCAAWSVRCILFLLLLLSASGASCSCAQTRSRPPSSTGACWAGARPRHPPPPPPRCSAPCGS